MDPHEDLNVGGLFGWVSGPALKVVEDYLESARKYPNPPAPNITQFDKLQGAGGHALQ
jgi:arylsulfatase